VSRAEFQRLAKLVHQRGETIEEMRRDFESRFRHDLDVQFQRIAQLQAEVDELKSAFVRMKIRSRES
jgi:hypothetical protein